MPDEPRLEEQLVSQVVQAGLSSQLDQAETVKVDVRTDLLKAVQGQVDSVAVTGQGMVVQDVRLETIEMRTDRVDLNLVSILLGKPELNHPINATAQVVLTEADVNRAVNAEAIATKLPPLKLNVEGELVTVMLQHPMVVKLLDAGRMNLDGEAVLHGFETTRKVRFSTTICLCSDQPLLLESFQCRPGEGLSLNLVIALMKKFKELLELPYIELDGIAIRITKLDVEAGKMTVYTEARVHQLPSP